MLIRIDAGCVLVYEIVKAHQHALRQQAAQERLAALVRSRRAAGIARRLALAVRDLALRLRRGQFA